MLKKYFKRPLALVLAIIMIASACALFGCQNSSGGNLDVPQNVGTQGTSQESTTSQTESEESTQETSQESTTSQTESEESTSADTSDTESESESESESTASTTESEGNLPYGTIFEGNTTEHTVVYALYTGTAVQDAVAKLVSAFDKTFKIDISEKKENAYNNANPGMTGKKIVVGYLEKDETSMEIYNSLNTQNSYIVKYVNNSLYIIGGSGEATAEAVDLFISTYLKYIRSKLQFEDGVIFEENDPPRFESLTIAGNAIDKYSIIYNDTSMGLRYAKEIRASITSITGKTLPIKRDDAGTGDYEILVGKVDRQESEAVRADYERPNLYYDAEVVGSKLVLMGEGWYTLSRISTEFEKHFASRDESKKDLTGTVFSGNVRGDIETTDMLDKAEGTDIRVFNYNVFGPTYDFDTYTMFTDDHERGLAIADVILAYYPDIITTNEFFPGHVEYDAVMGELGEYYTLIDSNSNYDYGYPSDAVSPETMPGYCGVPEQILVKKSCNFTVVDSGWRYWSKYIDAPDSWHGVHWVVFQTEAGQKFIITAGHYGDGRTDDTFAREHQAAIEMAQASSGSEEILPTVLAGDFFTTPGDSSYNYLIVTCGYKDAQTVKEINRNFSIYQATSHAFGKTVDGGTRLDFIFHNDGFTPLKFKVLKSKLLNYTSDHYPEVADLKFS